jgi:SAM-dependent methyltransferase
VDRPNWAPAEIDIERPSPARIYDYHLGGMHNFAADRQAAERIAAIMPELPLIMRANRAFLFRAVRFLVDAGIRQFLDLGSGIPTVGNVHEIAQRVAAGARVVYVDVDSVAVAHGRALLDRNDDAAAVQADLRDVPRVLAAPEVRRLIDFSRPVGVLMVAVLHFVSDRDDPAGVVARYRDAVAPGSYLVLSHAAASEDEQAPAGADAATAAYSRSVMEATLRTRAQVAGLLAGFEPVDPGVVYVTQWRPDTAADDAEPPQRLAQLVGVGRKPR